ncbi:hypothetical protein AB3Z07_28020 (plasmid) [Metabacillus halosaccharovorans]|uniref:hypothetical protein n=1 Tax=Metabacillus halosaccharovorans TaxID=930124 RepID=UPI0034CE90E3
MSNKRNRYKVTNENFEVFIRKVAHGWIRAHSYNNECFSYSEVSRAKSLQYFLNEVVERVEKLGYCAVATVHPVFESYDMYVRNPRPNLKQKVDENLLLDFSDLQQAFDYCEFAFKDRNLK